MLNLTYITYVKCNPFHGVLLLWHKKILFQKQTFSDNWWLNDCSWQDEWEGQISLNSSERRALILRTKLWTSLSVIQKHLYVILYIRRFYIYFCGSTLMLSHPGSWWNSSSKLLSKSFSPCWHTWTYAWI